MSKVAIIATVFLGLIIVTGLWLSGNYNSLVTSKNQVEKSWSMVESQYQRRFDLIDNLVASVKGSQTQEKEVFIKIAQARTAYNNAGSVNEKSEAIGSLETNIALIPRLQEAYPELKSNTQVTQLMSDLKSTEDGILTARNTFNTTATNYNINITRFPKNIFARVFGFEKTNLFKADAGASKATKVEF
jgi:LemA protein